MITYIRALLAEIAAVTPDEFFSPRRPVILSDEDFGPLNDELKATLTVMHRHLLRLEVEFSKKELPAMSRHDELVAIASRDILIEEFMFLETMFSTGVKKLFLVECAAANLAKRPLGIREGWRVISSEADEPDEPDESERVESVKKTKAVINFHDMHPTSLLLPRSWNALAEAVEDCYGSEENAGSDLKAFEPGNDVEPARAISVPPKNFSPPEPPFENEGLKVFPTLEEPEPTEVSAPGNTAVESLEAVSGEFSSEDDWH